MWQGVSHINNLLFLGRWFAFFNNVAILRMPMCIAESIYILAMCRRCAKNSINSQIDWLIPTHIFLFKSHSHTNTHTPQINVRNYFPGSFVIIYYAKHPYGKIISQLSIYDIIYNDNNLIKIHRVRLNDREQWQANWILKAKRTRRKSHLIFFYFFGANFVKP